MAAQDTAQNEILERLNRLEASQQQLHESLKAKDARIRELEADLQRLKADRQAPVATEAPPTAPVAAEAAPAVRPELVESAGYEPKVEKDAAPSFGLYVPGRGFFLGRTELGEVSFGAYTYLRYLNQKGLQDTYTNGLGEQTRVDKRDDLELNKVKLEFRGWMIDPRFQYVLYTWTNNAAMGLGAQVVVGGNLKFQVTDSMVIGGGILSLPTTRSTQGNFPYWLTVDHRTIADEFFRGSYATGFFSYGMPVEGLGYYVMLANNLSQLGVDAGQMDGEFTTASGALWWMPTTGEFGPRSSFGDFEMHEDLATRLGLHFTFSPEDRQSQPGTEDIDNTQIRLSNGTIIFTPGALGEGSRVNQVKYYMAAFDAGLKYRGFALEGEYYARWLDDFKAEGPLQQNSLFDHGGQLLGSTMVVPQTLQLYTLSSYIFGDHGDAWELGTGLNWWLFRRREIRLNFEYLYDHQSPIGYTAVPQVVGGTGSIFSANLELSF